MIVCICKGLSDNAIHGVIREGAETVEEIGDACGAGTDCGTCQGSLEELISEVQLTTRSAESRRQLRALRARCPAQSEVNHEGSGSGH